MSVGASHPSERTTMKNRHQTLIHLQDALDNGATTCLV